MDVLGIETRPDSWSVVHMKSSAFKVEVERFISLTGESFGDKVGELKAYVSQRRLKNVRIAVGLPREASLSMVLNIPAPRADAIEGILSYELEKHIPFDPEDVCHGFQILKKENKVFSILLAAAKKEIVEGMVESFAEAGLSLACVTTWHASLFNSLYYSNNLSPEKNIAFIGLNKKTLTLDIFSNLIPVYSKSVAIHEGDGAEGASLELVERELRRSVLSLSGPAENRRLDEGILISENEPDEEFLKLISSEMAMPVSAQGLKELGLPGNAATALGAALTLIGKGRMRINLTPQSGLAKKRLPYLNNLVLSGIVFILAIIAGSSYLVRDWITIGGLETAMAEVRVKKNAVQRLTDREKALSREVDTLEGIKGAKGPAPLDVLRDLTRLLPRDTWLTGFSLHGNSVSIEGYSDRASLLLMKMGKSSFMTDFEFAGPVARTPNNKERFRINFKLRGPSEMARGKRGLR